MAGEELQELRDKVRKGEVKGLYEVDMATIGALEGHIASLVANLLGPGEVKKVVVKVESHGIIADIAVRAPVDTGCPGQPGEERSECLQDYVKRYRREQGWEHRLRVKRVWEWAEALRYIGYDGQDVVFNILVAIDKEEMWLDAVMRPEEVAEKVARMAEKVLRL